MKKLVAFIFVIVGLMTGLYVIAAGGILCI
jgi:hypothetical protein